MEDTDSTNITCPSCGHGIDYHRPEEDAYIDVCWAVAAPATDGDPEDLCPCSLRPSEIAGGLLAHAREDIPALVAEVERLRRLGVEVVLLGESSSADTPILPRLARACRSAIAPVTQGRVTIRAFPAHRAAALGVLPREVVNG